MPMLVYRPTSETAGQRVRLKCCQRQYLVPQGDMCNRQHDSNRQNGVSVSTMHRRLRSGMGAAHQFQHAQLPSVRTPRAGSAARHTFLQRVTKGYDSLQPVSILYVPMIKQSFVTSRVIEIPTYMVHRVSSCCTGPDRNHQCAQQCARERH